MTEFLDTFHVQRAQEGQRIYAALFGRAAPPLLLQRYLAAAAQLDKALDPAQLAAYYDAVDSAADLEALEFAGRLTRRMPLLTRKFQAIVYLAETLPENQDAFVNRRSSFLAGLLAISAATLRSVFKALAGLISLQRA